MSECLCETEPFPGSARLTVIVRLSVEQARRRNRPNEENVSAMQQIGILAREPVPQNKHSWFAGSFGSLGRGGVGIPFLCLCL
ncbi:hypothetical protein SAMN02799630_01449 [Paenibacillus sp. UNCCL117]|nr:hypothetical protein SAMN04488602_103428 [Paenibacillus sp. cl123]SFW25828.1 hypothetical protein SAMN02799630_01449 [Paenibacillus sp. UNCCL117]